MAAEQHRAAKRKGDASLFILFDEKALSTGQRPAGCRRFQVATFSCSTQRLRVDVTGKHLETFGGAGAGTVIGQNQGQGVRGFARTAARHPGAQHPVLLSKAKFSDRTSVEWTTLWRSDVEITFYIH